MGKVNLKRGYCMVFAPEKPVRIWGLFYMWVFFYNNPRILTYHFQLKNFVFVLFSLESSLLIFFSEKEEEEEVLIL